MNSQSPPDWTARSSKGVVSPEARKRHVVAPSERVAATRLIGPRRHPPVARRQSTNQFPVRADCKLRCRRRHAIQRSDRRSGIMRFADSGNGAGNAQKNKKGK